MRERRLRLGRSQPAFLLREPRLDIADSLEIFVELVGVGGTEPALHALRVFKHRVEHAPLFDEHLLPLCERHVVGREELVEGDHGAVETRDRLPAAIPGQGQARSMSSTVEAGLTAVELKRRKPRVAAELAGHDLVHRERFCGTGAGEPHRAATVRVARERMRAALHDREAIFVPGERREPIGERVAGADIVFLRKPCLLGHAIADAKADHPLRPGRRCCRPCKPAEAERFKRGEGQERSRRLEHPAAGWHGHGGISGTCGGGVSGLLLRAEGRALDDRMNELANGKVFGSGPVNDRFHEVVV